MQTLKATCLGCLQVVEPAGSICLRFGERPLPKGGAPHPAPSLYWSLSLLPKTARASRPGTTLLLAGFALLLVQTLVLGQSTFSNPTAISIPDHGSAQPFASTITVAGSTGLISHVTVTLNNFSHSWLQDLSISVVGPAGQTVSLLSGAGRDCALQGATLTFSDSAAATVPFAGTIGTSGFQPSNYSADGTVAVPSAGPQASVLSSLCGLNPNGSWSLFVTDRAAEDSGSIAGGWSLQFTTTNSPVVTPIPAVTTPPPTNAPPTSPTTGIQAWQTQYFAAAVLADPNKSATVWGDMADPDNDGRNNLMEYALGLNPIDASDVQQGISSRLVTEGANHFLYFTYNRRKNDPNLVYVAQVSGDLRSWSSAIGAVAQISTNDLSSDLQVVTCKDLTPVGPGKPRFFQLEVQRRSGPTSGTFAASESYVATGALIHGGISGGAQLSYFSLSSVQPAAAAGLITALGSSTLTDVKATWPSGLLNAGSGAYYVEFSNGLSADIVAANAATKTLTLAGDLRPYMPVGSAYKVRRHATLADVFGANDETGLGSGTSSALADNIILRNNQTQTSQIYFYCPLTGVSGWYRADNLPAGNTPIYPEQGITVSRKAFGDVVAYMTGVVKDTPTMAPIAQGLNLVGPLKAAQNMTLSQLNLYTGDPTTGLAAGNSPSIADNIMIPTSGGTAIYFYCNVPGSEGWWNAAYQPSGNVPIPAGSAFFIMRKAPNADFHWVIPGE
jgi:subtilisin-like proprotein convertase family protein